MNPTKSEVATTSATPAATRRDTLSIVDNRTGQQYEIPIKNDTIRALDLRQIKVNDADFGMMSYDPALHEHRVLHQQDHFHRRRSRASCAIAATPSKNWRRKALISKRLT